VPLAPGLSNAIHSCLPLSDKARRAAVMRTVELTRESKEIRHASC
jgi:hypothetical protein